MTQPLCQADGLTVRDSRGRYLAFERWEDGRVSAWMADQDGEDTAPVGLSDSDRRRIASFLMEGLA